MKKTRKILREKKKVWSKNKNKNKLIYVYCVTNNAPHDGGNFLPVKCSNSLYFLCNETI